jgi:hypothetical protein
MAPRIAAGGISDRYTGEGVSRERIELSVKLTWDTVGCDAHSGSEYETADNEQGLGAHLDTALLRIKQELTVEPTTMSCRTVPRVTIVTTM